MIIQTLLPSGYG